MLRSSLTLGDVIRRFGPALLERRAEQVTSAQRAVLATLGRCHTAALGGHLYRCDGCGTERPAYNSCGNRHCPSCLAHKSAQWLEDRSAELLPVPYFHVVFTVPAEIASLALGNKKVVYSILFRAASETLLQVAKDPKLLGANIGFLAILHTWTQTLLHHPHVHCIVPGGGLSADGSRWISARENFFLPYLVLSHVYREKFLSYLAQAARAGELKFAGATSSLAEPSAFADFIQEHQDKEWVVYIKPPFGSPEQVLKYLARYTHRVAISDRRLVAMDEETVSFGYRDREANRSRVMKLEGVEFLRRFLLHVLPTSFVRIRYYGLLANRGRAENLTLCRELLGRKADPPAKPEREDDEPPRCPACGTGRLLRVRTLEPEPVPELDAWAPSMLPVRRDTS